MFYASVWGSSLSCFSISLEYSCSTAFGHHLGSFTQEECERLNRECLNIYLDIGVCVLSFILKCFTLSGCLCLVWPLDLSFSINIEWSLGCFQYLQALLQRTLSDYKMVGYDPESSSLEIRLIQSQDDIRHPQVKYMAERYSWIECYIEQ